MHPPRGSDEVVLDAGALQRQVMAESRDEHLAAGLINNTRDVREKESRLSRELTALSIQGVDLNLGDKRAVILRRLYDAYASEAARQRLKTPIRRPPDASSTPAETMGAFWKAVGGGGSFDFCLCPCLVGLGWFVCLFVVGRSCPPRFSSDGGIFFDPV